MQIQSVNVTPALSSQTQNETLHQNGTIKAEQAVAPVQAGPTAVQAIDPKQQAKDVEDAVKKINETVQALNQNVGLEFSTDQDTKIQLVRLIDTKSKEILRQIPSAEVISIAKALDRLQGLLVRDKA
ncbi:flagellar protein FlaG [Chitinibacter bivalviorum]|uniref:Flagellar protein FlaG n=1 Tax=Chitinibacter bivalviorum TaxID=2739434 RepID=A0A7H9BGR3_9NEIS|nr:flagellar protein FlaG [Chitinibacter bivalviorum]QLG87398.1 flagellar protein FlaG [Chitinibacter bivalviorum]